MGKYDNLLILNSSVSVELDRKKIVKWTFIISTNAQYSTTAK